MEKYLNNLYSKFLKFEKSSLQDELKNYCTSVEGLKISSKTVADFYSEYYEPTFAGFLRNMKLILFSPTPFDFIAKDPSEDWDLWRYLEFFTKEKVLSVSATGKAILLKKAIANYVPRPQSYEQIKKEIEQRLEIRAVEKEPVINLFRKFHKFSVKSKWDQMPVSAASAFFTVQKILDYLPKNKKFLFVGDDDFISVLLGLVAPEVESVVIDADDEVLKLVGQLAKKFNLKINTKKVDIRKTKLLGEKFVGFLCNPAYTELGAKEFVEFATRQLSKDGGYGFLTLGDEAIGKRFLFLQESFTKNHLVIKELITGKISYPYMRVWEEDREIEQRLLKFFGKKNLYGSPKLGAKLYVFEYLPKYPKRLKLKRPIYAYI